MARNRGAGPGFEFLRYALAVAVLVAHIKWLVGSSAHDAIIQVQHAAQAGAAFPATNADWFPGLGHWQAMVFKALVPAFFALSGFLVTGSALRVRRVPTFLAFRVLRIVPALGVEISLSALVLGPALTTFTLSQYVRDPLLPAYFLNILGHPQYLLPGLFTDNPVPVVNGNLWTLPGEFICYLAMSILMISRIAYQRTWLTAIFCLATLLLGVGNIIWAFDADWAGAPRSSYALPLYFFAGVVLYHWKDRLALKLSLFIASALLSMLLLSDARLIYLAPLPLTYCTVAVGMYRVPSLWLLNSGDYSYGIYLYGAPLMQALINLFPAFRGHSARLIVPALVVTYIFAFGSWHLIEKHALKLKRVLPEKLFPRHSRVIPPSIGNVVPAVGEA